MNSPEVLEGSFTFADQFMGLNLPNGTGDAVTKLIGFAAAGFGVLAIKASVKKVKANHVGLRTRRGRLFNKKDSPYGCERPGIHFIVPLISDIEMVEIREDSASVERPLDIYSPGLGRIAQKNVGITVGWTVRDEEINGRHAAYLALTKISEKENARSEIVKRVVGGVMCRLANTYAQNRTELLPTVVPELVMQHSGEELARYGLGLTAATVTMFTDSDPERLGNLIALGQPIHSQLV